MINTKTLLMTILLFFAFLLSFNLMNNSYAEDDQSEALEAFQRLMDYFGIKEDGDVSFPDYYSGCRLDSDNKLIIYLTSDDSELKSTLREVLNYEHVEFIKVDYSYTEFDYVDKIIANNVQELYENGIQVMSVYFDIDTNKKTIRVKDLTDNKIEIIQRLISTNEVVFENIPSSKLFNEAKQFEIIMNKVRRLYPYKYLSKINPIMKSIDYSYSTFRLAIASKAETNGVIEEIDNKEKRILVSGIGNEYTKYAQTSTWFSIDDNTIIRDIDYNAYKFKDFYIGMRVLGYTSDGVLLTDPSQTYGDLIIIMD
ncbi:hypothetical protein EZV73_25110 [Acidaminobacter sp. JC074]|uniref:hypothetical protein n=1 Tax=Acidaminobacter sp. JC074 TaxID=2530199 RepID=UPI001F0F9B30|nr:hypothetical protein [Acidaminobacter sp. JC074]MCH4890884.1 hypothetical protein [Acidaminobacter sp. JC074]